MMLIVVPNIAIARGVLFHTRLKSNTVVGASAIVYLVYTLRVFSLDQSVGVRYVRYQRQRMVLARQWIRTQFA